jgi:alcohol dehydrogenase class IV
MAYLPRAVADGSDLEARERLHNAATCAGLGFGNAMASMAHAMGHALGAIFHLPHGRAVGICLPYTVEFAAREAPERFADLACFLHCATSAGEEGARALATALRDLYQQIGVPISLTEAGIERVAFEDHLDKLVDDAFNDTQMITAVRSPSYEELRRLFGDVYEGRAVDY